jgi:hypothetical protein
MRRTHVTIEDVRACIENPESTSPSIKGRTNYKRSLGRRGTLRVTAIPEQGQMVIITVTLARRK